MSLTTTYHHEKTLVACKGLRAEEAEAARAVSSTGTSNNSKCCSRKETNWKLTSIPPRTSTSLSSSKIPRGCTTDRMKNSFSRGAQINCTMQTSRESPQVATMISEETIWSISLRDLAILRPKRWERIAPEKRCPGQP